MKKIISDEFWNCMKDLFPNNQGKPGRPPMRPRKALSGIMFVLENGSKWRFLPSVYGKPTTVHGTFMRWIRNGTFESIVERAKKFYLSSTKSVPSWYAIDTSSSKAPYANWAGNNPTDRGKHGVKKSIIIDRKRPCTLLNYPSMKKWRIIILEIINENRPNVKVE